MKVELDLQYFAEMGGIFEGEDSELVKNMNVHMILMHYYAKKCMKSTSLYESTTHYPNGSCEDRPHHLILNLRKSLLSTYQEI